MRMHTLTLMEQPYFCPEWISIQFGACFVTLIMDLSVSGPDCPMSEIVVAPQCDYVDTSTESLNNFKIISICLFIFY